MPASLRKKAVEIPAFIPPVIPDMSDGYIPEVLSKFLEKDTFKLLINGFVICNDRFYDLYGLRDAIILLERLKDKGKKADLVIIILGPPDNNDSRKYLNSLKEYTFTKSLEGNIFWVENTVMELWPVLKKVHVFLRPTKSDGDALSIRESLWLKKPVIASGVVPRPEGTVIYDGNSENDFLYKTLSVIDNYHDYVESIGNYSTSFAPNIIGQYEFK
jgi:glycosyltransferase involved in cell wall biosynthesis